TELTGADIVITSTWRVESPLEELRNLLKDWGVEAKVIDVTPLIEHGSRADEISAWIKDMELQGQSLDSFCVIDDQEIGGFTSMLVRSDERIGLCQDHVRKIIAILSAGIP